MKKIILCIILITLTVSAFSCDKRQGNTAVSETADVYVSEDTRLPDVSLTADHAIMQVACGDGFTLAKTVSGDILFTGNCAAVFRDKDALCDSLYITAHGKTAAGITKNGRVVVIGENKELFSASAEWTDVVDLSVGNDFMLGLNCTGHVLSCGRNSYGKCATDELSSVVAISAGRNHFAAVLSDGTVAVGGAYSDEKIFEEWHDVREIACGDFSVIALTLSGDVLTYHADDVSGWEGVTDIYAFGDTIAAVTENGIITNNTDYAQINERSVQGISVGADHIAFISSDGSVKCAGTNDDMECALEGRHLGVTVENGYITGFSDKTTVDEAISLTEIATGRQIKSDASEKNGYIGTGAQLKYADGEAAGTVIIYGDVNGDGIINSVDSARMRSHADGTEKLTGAYEKAAHVLHYLSDVRSIGTDEISAVTEYETGYRHIDQHVYDPYAEDIAKFYSINSDTRGYIKVQGTQIDHPIMYGAGYYYNNHDAYRHSSSLGAIYSIHDSYKKNNVVIGHNARRSGKMFHGLHKIEDRGEKLKNFSDRLVNVTLYHEYSTWELFALYETGPREPATTQLNNLNSLNGYTDEQIQEWIDAQIARSTRKLGVDDVTYEDTLLTLYTCGDEYYSDSSTQSRLYLFFRRVG